MSIATTDEQLYNTYLDIALNACRRGQYARAEMLLPGAISDAEYHQMIDPRLISIIYGMASFYVFENNLERAKELYQRLIQLKQTVTHFNYFDDCQFEKMAIDQFMSERSSQNKMIMQVRNRSKRPHAVKWLLSLFPYRKRFSAC